MINDVRISAIFRIVTIFTAYHYYYYYNYIGKEKFSRKQVKNMFAWMSSTVINFTAFRNIKKKKKKEQTKNDNNKQLYYPPYFFPGMSLSRGKFLLFVRLIKGGSLLIQRLRYDDEGNFWNHLGNGPRSKILVTIIENEIWPNYKLDLA